MALVGHISGSSQSNSVIGISGSVIIANRPDSLFPVMPGLDTLLFVSGAIGGANSSERSVAVFGGDVVVSGTFYGKNGITIPGDVLELTGSLLLSGNAIIDGDLTVNGTTTTINTVNLEVKDAVVGLGFSSGTIALTAGDRGWIGGIDGGPNVAMLWKNAQSEFALGTTSISSTGSLPISIDSYSNLHVANIQANIVTASGGFTGSLTQLANGGGDYLRAGAGITLSTGSLGEITITNLNAVDTTPEYFSSTTNGSIFTTGSTGFVGGEGIDSPSDKGSDVFFYVSGSLNTGTELSLFGGDVRISGSFSQGLNTLATGSYSHAEGNGTTAKGNRSHAEGYQTSANGESSHTEGDNTFAGHWWFESTLGMSAGTIEINSSYGDVTALFTGGTLRLTNFGGYYLEDSIAGTNFDGANTFVTASAGTTVAGPLYVVDTSYLTEPAADIRPSKMHAEGYGALALGEQSHAEGESVKATGTSSHAEGKNTTASGAHSHAEGRDSTASGQDSHAEGYFTTASGAKSHAEGFATTASGAQSHAEGQGTVALGDQSHAAGFSTIASGSAQTVVGRYNNRDNTTSLFTIGDGVGDDNVDRHDLLNAKPGLLEVTGSFDLTGHLTASSGLFNGAVLPGADMAYNLGSESFRWSNVYTGDLHLKNDRGNWTVIEEAEYLSIRNNNTGKMYRFVMEEVEADSPAPKLASKRPRTTKK